MSLAVLWLERRRRDTNVVTDNWAVEAQQFVELRQKIVAGDDGPAC